jgi:hypothetical protein
MTAQKAYLFFALVFRIISNKNKLRGLGIARIDKSSIELNGVGVRKWPD